MDKAGVEQIGCGVHKGEYGRRTGTLARKRGESLPALRLQQRVEHGRIIHVRGSSHTNQHFRVGLNNISKVSEKKRGGNNTRVREGGGGAIESERAVAYFGEESAGTEKCDEVPITEPLCELEAAVGVAAATASWDVWCAEFIERAHHLLDRLVFEPRTIFNREMMRSENWRWILRKAMRDLYRSFFILFLF